MGTISKPRSSRASRMAPTLPSIMSDGATMSAPASAWDTATWPRTSRVVSLSTSWPDSKPQWPWEV